MGEFFSKLFDTSDFPARWYCGNWSDFLGWLHIISDLGTWGAYFAIPVVLIYFARKRNDLPFTGLSWLFASFIFACGLVHLTEAIIFWYPIYRISALVKFATATVSWATVIALIQVAPKAMNLPSLATTNKRLGEEIDERKRVELELRAARDDLQRQKRELELMYESAPVGMSLVDRQLRYIRINDRLAGINGRSPEDHIGRRIRDMLPELGEQIEAFHRKVLESGQPLLDMELTGRRQHDMAARTWLVSYFPLRNGEGAVDAISAVVHDITDRKLQEDRLLQSEHIAQAANQSKSEFLANMSHEIRTPMAAILGYADVLLGHLKDPDNRNCVLIVKKNGQYLLELINDILDLSRIEAGKLDIEIEPCNLLRLVSDIYSLMLVRASEKQLELHARFDSPVPETILTDATRLRQVLINLIGNAIKFTDQGSVVLSVRMLERDEPTLEFAVMDTGIGMSDEQQSRLFKPFSQGDASVTRQYGGSGLGLAISQRLINMLEGELTAQSKPGEGSTFRVWLPVKLNEPSKMVQPTLEEHVKLKDETVKKPCVLNCRVLVVDDRRDVRHISQHFLEKAGATVFTAEDGQKGVDEAIAARNANNPFDLVVMDMQMPNLDGLQATAQLRSAGIECPIIALTADAMNGDRERCLSGGCDGYLSKPIDAPELVELVGRYTQEISLAELRTQRLERAAALKASIGGKASS